MIVYIRHVQVLEAKQINELQRKPKGQLRLMQNPEKLATRQSTKTNKAKKKHNTEN